MYWISYVFSSDLPVPKREQRKLRPGGLLQLRDGVQSGLRPLEGHLLRFDPPHTSLLHRRGLGDCPSHVRSQTLCSERRSEEHTSELQSLMRISYAVFCLKKKK